MSTTDKKIALVTGANKGIGLAIARKLGQLGCGVLVGARDKKRGQTATDQLKAEGIDAHLLILDIAYQPSLDRAATLIGEDYGRLDILVNNAAVIHDRRLMPSTTPLDTIREVFEPNFFGTVATTQTLLPLLRKSPAGRIVNLSSGLGSLTLHSDPSGPFDDWMVLGYSASKAALNMFTVQLARELRDTTIKVNAASPGWIKTDMGGPDAPGTPEEGADTPVWLATLPADGPSGGFFSERQPLPW
jgi:NAD(P)-dependent dehydrogenase (short-subunit alcohol dehydrogenase family)